MISDKINKYKKWLARKQKILDLLENNKHERWKDVCLGLLSGYSQAFVPGRWTADAISFQEDDTFTVTWRRWCEGDEYDTTKNIHVSFFEDPDGYVKKHKEEKDLKVKQRLKSERKELYDKLKQEFEPFRVIK